MNRTELSILAWDVASDGLAGHADAVADVVSAARAGGLSPVLVDVLADPLAPEPARLRAFGHIAAALAAADTPTVTAIAEDVRTAA